MHSSSSVVVIERSHWWDVAVNGETRPLLDWFLSADRALGAAQVRATKLGLDAVGVVRRDGSVESWVTTSGERVSRFSQLGW